jgi:serine protease DegS
MLQIVLFNDTRIMLGKSYVLLIGLIVGGLLLLALPSLRQFNKLSAPQFDSTDETPASYNRPFAAPHLPW